MGEDEDGVMKDKKIQNTSDVGFLDLGHQYKR